MGSEATVGEMNSVSVNQRNTAWMRQTRVCEKGSVLWYRIFEAAVLGLDKAALDGRLGENAATFKKKSGRSAPLCSSDVQGPPHKPSGQSRKAWTSVTVKRFKSS